MSLKNNDLILFLFYLLRRNYEVPILNIVKILGSFKSLSKNTVEKIIWEVLSQEEIYS